MHGSNISKDGVSDVGLHKAGKLIDNSGCSKKSVVSGANINKQSPGMNSQIVPPVAPK